MPTRRPTESDRHEAIRALLAGLRRGAELPDLALSVQYLHPRDNTFPGEVFMEVAVQAMDLAGIEQRGLPYEELLNSHLPEDEFRGPRAQKIKFAILATGATEAASTPTSSTNSSGGGRTISGSMPSRQLRPLSEPARPSRQFRSPI